MYLYPIISIRVKVDEIRGIENIGSRHRIFEVAKFDCTIIL